MHPAHISSCPHLICRQPEHKQYVPRGLGCTPYYRGWQAGALRVSGDTLCLICTGQGHGQAHLDGEQDMLFASLLARLQQLSSCASAGLTLASAVMQVGFAAFGPKLCGGVANIAGYTNVIQLRKFINNTIKQVVQSRAR